LSDPPLPPISDPPLRPSLGRSGPVPSGEPTPVTGTPVTPRGSASTPAPAADEEGGGDEDDSSPHPNFWSPFSRSPAGPPPTWSTPVTPREPPADGS
jgi:hypothetical protein